MAVNRLLTIQVTKALLVLTEDELLNGLPRPLLVRALKRGKALKRRQALERRCAPGRPPTANPQALAAPGERNGGD